jgi:hypothetical protein
LLGLSYGETLGAGLPTAELAGSSDGLSSAVESGAGVVWLELDAGDAVPAPGAPHAATIDKHTATTHACRERERDAVPGRGRLTGRG